MQLKNILSQKKTIFYILLIPLFIRVLIGSFSTLGNDEIYYTLYAKYLDYAYFDHPPMVGWLIWLTTFGNNIQHEFFYRLGALIVGSCNIYMLYKIGKLLKDRVTGNLIALLASTSFYVGIISGTFIMPDTPQSLFWVAAIWTFLKYISQKKNIHLVVFGILVGFALLSKYHAIYLWLGVFIYLLIKDRKQFLNPYLYLSGFISILLFSPVIIWNIISPYSGLSYHENRVGSDSILPNFKHFFPEFFGQFFYNNPFNVLLIISTLFMVKKQKITLQKPIVFLLSVSLPLIATTLLMAMYNQTLPHWSGPSYFGLLIITGYFLVETETFLTKKNSILIKGSLVMFLLVLVLGMFQIRTGLILGNPNAEAEKLGKDDFTIDLAQWKKIGAELENNIPKKAVIVSHNWFPASHLTKYFGEKNECKVYVFGTPDKKHQFLKINKDLGKIPLDSDVYFITTSHYYEEPSEELINYFQSKSKRKIISITQLGRKKVNVFIWKLNELKNPLL